MPRAKKKYPEVDNIKDDINSLKSNTIELGRHIKDDGAEKTEEIKKAAQSRLDDLTVKGRDQLKKAEIKVKEKPLQSMAVAFAAGLAFSILMGRR
jgi:ElaB/YqjD/DUF883 family membrane-anchored ribosome-binding protein